MDPMLPTIVAVAIFLLFAVVTLTAMQRYTFEQAMKVWQAEVGLLGTIIGMIGSFFFAQASIATLTETRDKAQLQASQAAATSEKLEQARQQIAGKLAQREDELSVARLDAKRSRLQLAAADKQKDTVYACLAKPEFRQTVLSAYATTQPTVQDIEALLKQFSSPEDSPPSVPSSSRVQPGG